MFAAAWREVWVLLWFWECCGGGSVGCGELSRDDLAEPAGEGEAAARPSERASAAPVERARAGGAEGEGTAAEVADAAGAGS